MTDLANRSAVLCRR